MIIIQLLYNNQSQSINKTIPMTSYKLF